MKDPAPGFRIAVALGAIWLALPGWAQTATTPPAPAPAAAPSPPLKDADGRTLRRAPSGHITNYYEEKIPPYILPDVLTLQNGQPVRDAATWTNQRRPELIKRYESEIYGRVPATAPQVKFEVVGADETVLEGKAVRRHIVGKFGDQPDGPAVNVMLYRPAGATGPLPLVLHVTFGGDASLPPPPPPPGAPPGAPVRRFNDGGPIAEILSHGYAYAILRYAEIQPDTAAGLTRGVIGLALTPGQEKPAPDEWGTIAAWTWGLSRIMDYLETDPSVDAKRVALVGHSRLGKTVLWSGATDRRYALIYSSQSGEMGAALSRRDFGETVDDMAASFGYQFAGNLRKYIGHWNDLPHEGHLLISLSAPRPVFISAGSADIWSDPRGQFLATVAAGPVWRLLGQPDLGTTEMPELDVPVAAGTLAYLNHNGPHAVTPLDWKTFLDFADRHLQGALYFSSPEQSVTRITELLKAKNWPELARYYDLTGTGIARSELESGAFFIRTDPPENAHPGGLWKYREPFAPGYTFISYGLSAVHDEVLVMVGIAIDEGGGLVQRGRTTYHLRQSAAGYQLLPMNVPAPAAPFAGDPAYASTGGISRKEAAEKLGVVEEEERSSWHAYYSPVLQTWFFSTAQGPAKALERVPVPNPPLPQKAPPGFEAKPWRWTPRPLPAMDAIAPDELGNWPGGATRFRKPLVGFGDLVSGAETGTGEIDVPRDKIWAVLDRARERGLRVRVIVDNPASAGAHAVLALSPK